MATPVGERQRKVVDPFGFEYEVSGDEAPSLGPVGPAAVLGKKPTGPRKIKDPFGFEYDVGPEPTPEEVTNIRYRSAPPPGGRPAPSGEGVFGAAVEVAKPVARLIDLVVARPAGAALKGLEVAAAHPLRTIASPSLLFRAAKEQYLAPESEGVLTLLVRQASEAGRVSPVIPSTPAEIEQEGKRRTEYTQDIMSRGLAGPAAHMALQFAEAGVPATAPLVAALKLAAAAGKRSAQAALAAKTKAEELMLGPKVRPQALDANFLSDLQRYSGSEDVGRMLHARAIQQLAEGAEAEDIKDAAIKNAVAIRKSKVAGEIDDPQAIKWAKTGEAPTHEFGLPGGWYEGLQSEDRALSGKPGVVEPAATTRSSEISEPGEYPAITKTRKAAPVKEGEGLSTEARKSVADISEAEVSAPPESKPAFFAAKQIASEPPPKEGKPAPFSIFSKPIAEQLKYPLQAIRDGFVNLTERARQSELAGRIGSGILKGAHLMGDTKGMFSYGVPRNFEEANLRRMSNTQLGIDTVGKIASDLAPDRGPWIKFLFGTKRGLNEADYLAVGQVRNREWSTPEIEKAIGDMFESLPGGRKGALERMQAIKASLTERLASMKSELPEARAAKSVAVQKVEARLKDLDAKITRLTTGDAVEVRADAYSRSIGEIVLPSIRDDFANGQHLVNIGALSEEAFLNEAGRYQWRWRGPREEPSEIPAGTLFQAMRLRGPFLKARLRDLTEEQKAKIVTNVPEFLYRTRAVQEKVYAADHNFFSELAGFSDVSSATELPGWKRLVMDRSGRPARTPRDVDMKKTRQLYGDLAGRYVEPKSYQQLMETFDQRNRSWALKLFDLTQQGWGFGKVVLNPATHARNVYADVMMAWTAGVWPHELFTRGAAASRELVGKGPIYQEAVRAGMAPHSYGSGEAMLFDNALAQAGREGGSAGEQFVTALHRAFTAGTQLPGIRHMSRIYQYEDNIFRMMVYIKAREHGMTPLEAVRHVDKHIPDYRQVAKVWDSYGRRLYPLNTFNYKMATNLPNLMTSGIIGGSGKRFVGERQRVLSVGLPAAPGDWWTSDIAATARFYAGYAGYYGLKKLSEETGGVTPEGWAATQELSPDYVKDGIFLPLQVKDSRGVWTVLDLTNAVPWGSLVNMVKRSRHSDVVDFLRSVAPSTPIAQAVLSASYGFDNRGRRLWSDDMEKAANAGDKAAKEERSRRLQAYWVDAFLPSMFSLTPRRIAAAARGEEFRGRGQTVPQALAQSVLGITAQTLKPREAAEKSSREIGHVIRSEAAEQEFLQSDIATGAAGKEAGKRIANLIQMRQRHADRLRRIEYLLSLVERAPRPSPGPVPVAP